MLWNDLLTKLCGVLADLYGDLKQASRIAQQAGLDLRKIDLSGPSQVYWHAILEEAEKGRQVSDICQEAEKEYSKSPELKAASSAYRQWAQENDIAGFKLQGEGATASPDDTRREQGIASVYIDETRAVFSHRMAQSDSDYVGPVPAGELDKIRAVYVPTARDDQAMAILAARHVLVIRGQAHRGKLFAGLHALSALHSAITEISPSAILSAPRTFSFKPKEGYIIDTLVSGEQATLTAGLLGALRNKLAEVQSHLIITVDKRTPIHEEDLSGYVVAWDQLPGPLAVLSKHLAWYLPQGDPAEVQKMLGSPSVQRILGSHLLPRQIDQLAALLAEVVRGKMGLEQALAQFEAQAYREVEDWFSQHQGWEERSLLISIAVLNGATYQAIREAYGLLQEHIKPIMPIMPQDRPTAPDVTPSKTHSQRLKDVCAHSASQYTQAHYGSNQVETVELDNPAFQPAVLHYVFDELDDWQGPLLAWLWELGLYEQFEVRARAAAAVGELSKLKFALVEREVLSKWAMLHDDDARASVALALGIAAWEDECAPQALGLLHYWSTLGRTWASWSAAEAYGGLVGRRFPEIALQNLGHLVRRSELRSIGVVSQSVIRLFGAGEDNPVYYQHVLDALLSWTAERKDRVVTLAGLLIYLDLAYRARVQAPPFGGKWPSALKRAIEDRATYTKVLQLWYRALNTDQARRFAEDVIKYWVSLADEDERLYETLERLVLALAKASPHNRMRMEFLLSSWSQDPHQPLRTALRVLATMKSKPE